jgi:hypothetical protein
MRDSFDRFEKVVDERNHDDAIAFPNISMQDVYQTAREIEKELEKKQLLRNLRRIHPFLEGLNRYAKVMEKLCDGSPYLPWIWVCGRSNSTLWELRSLCTVGASSISFAGKEKLEQRK